MATADLQVGPWGGVAGLVDTPWHFYVDGKICTIEIRCEGIVNAIRFSYKDDAGEIHPSPWIGGSGGELQPPIEIPDDEEIIQIIGKVGDILVDSNTIVITSLAFQTINNAYQTKKIYGPYGMDTGENFSLPLKEGKWAGFFGNEGDYNFNLGVFLKPLEKIIPPWVWVGPWGGEGGNPWQFITYGKISMIEIKYGRCVQDITFYDRMELHSPSYDGDGGTVVTIITFSDDEEIVRVSGTVGVILTDDDDIIVITSLTFQTNKDIYGPYGTEKGEHFSLPLKEGKFVGFFGKKGYWLDSFGAILGPKTGN